MLNYCIFLLLITTSLFASIPTYQAQGVAKNGTGSSTPAWPAHQINDIALLFVETRSSNPVTLSTPAGFAAVSASPQFTGISGGFFGSNGTRLSIFWARASSSSMQSPVIADPGNHIYAQILTYRGVASSGIPWDTTSGGIKSTASTSLSVTGLTTTVANTLIVQAASRDTDSASAAFSAQTNANLTNIIERIDAGTTSGDGGGIAVWDGGKATPGATGNTTATVASAGSSFSTTNPVNAFLTIALKPAGTTPISSYTFDVWDSFRSISDRNVSTKVAGKSFDLTIASLDSTNTALQDFNGTLCARIVNQADQNMSSWNKLLFNNVKSLSTVFTINNAIGGSDSAGIDLHWVVNQNTTCPLMTETNTTHASDRFSVRPASFGLSAPNATAAVDFNLTFSAPNFTAGASNGYNETVTNSFDLSIAEHNTSCITGTFSTPVSTGWSFSNGSKILSTKYSEVGILDINLSDTGKPCASRYTKIDCDDANVSDGTNWTANLLPIGTTQIQITVKPHHFDLNATLSNSTNSNFTYLSTDLNMSASLNLNVTAKNGDGNVTKNYSKGCYAKNTTLTLPHSTVPNPLTKILYHENISGIDSNISKSSNIQLDFNKTVFTQGTAPLTLLLNFDRNSSSLLNPFDFNLTSASISDSDGVIGNSSPSGTATFAYGRTRAYDIKTDQSLTPNPIEFEVYSSTSTGYVTGMPQSVLHWYRNLNHDASAQGSILLGGFSAGTTSPSVNVSSAPQDGLQLISIASSSNQTVHLAVPSWLWYSPNQNYNYSADCTKHPCFDYQFFTTSVNTSGIQSGTFQGSDFTLSPAKTIIKKGVKVFR